MITAVSVIVAHYGDPALAERLVARLGEQQESPELEVIVVDDASPVPFPEPSIVPEVQVIRRMRNGGFGAAINTGAAVARHPYLLILNSDLVIEPDFVGRLCHQAARWQPAVAGPLLVDLHDRAQWSGRWFPTTGHYLAEWLTPLARLHRYRIMQEALGHDTRCVPGAVQAVDWLVGAALLIPAAAFAAVGGFDERYRMYCEEIDLQRRLRDRGVPSVFVGEVSARHIGGASGGTADLRRRRMVAARYAYARRWGGHPALLRAALTGATTVNLLANSVRRAAGRRVEPIAVARAEFGLLRSHR